MKCTICQLNNVAAINKDLLRGKGFRSISRSICGGDSKRESLRRHAENCLAQDLQVAVKEHRITNAVDAHKELTELFAYAQELKEASKRALLCPITGELTFEPRAYEGEIIFEDLRDRTNSGEPKRKKENLQSLLDRISNVENGTHYSPISAVIKTADIRELALKVIDRVESLGDKFARFEGLYTKEKEHPQTQSQRTKDIILRLFEQFKDSIDNEGLINWLQGKFECENVRAIISGKPQELTQIH